MMGIECNIHPSLGTLHQVLIDDHQGCPVSIAATPVLLDEWVGGGRHNLDDKGLWNTSWFIHMGNTKLVKENAGEPWVLVEWGQ